MLILDIPLSSLLYPFRHCSLYYSFHYHLFSINWLSLTLQTAKQFQQGWCHRKHCTQYILWLVIDLSGNNVEFVWALANSRQTLWWWSHKTKRASSQSHLSKWDIVIELYILLQWILFKLPNIENIHKITTTTMIKRRMVMMMMIWSKFGLVSLLVFTSASLTVLQKILWWLFQKENYSSVMQVNEMH